ncbi:OmpA family protein [Burkholderia pseudomultivorans]|uniref:OmpA family protein n=1 Tax=Burkholderia pseudomultivorans TaxID=1207504 RepID=A0A6P2LBJ3_9BURK|nr:OmpA family protein [Burkholderia pseudomultivorans]MDR8727612.1 Outer membrane protein A [Burkholderia pseudomultivorans]MDR8734592.1 Outer membrane protein A [Burkholderia pseudomultivorans]MDR8740558.1 Outer membrane protein A [Burkholderia pseudomultivorans]MDR8751777.1 Outer membrane protein A [Burkholderia pseudomultivorans]MDR8776972.1 Outer membrane protein A [Burkholderia pseudomultivorans]
MKHASTRYDAGSRRHRIATAVAGCGLLAAAWFADIAPASAQVMVLAPPAPVYEAAPAPRIGYAWERGYWGWQYGRYVWVPGHWSAVERRVAMPPPAAPVAQVMRLSADALFAFDRGDLADILPGGRADIREIAARLSATRFGRIEVRGYTDRLGSAAYNQQLSQRRANAVKALLVEHGIPADRIDARGFGEQDPITHCADTMSHDRLVACLQPDRRVEIVSFARGDARDTMPSPP